MTISGPQMNYLTSLLATRQTPDSLRGIVLTSLTTREASAAIDTLKLAPWKPRPNSVLATQVKEAVPVGFYFLDGEVYRVKASKATPARRYAYIFQVAEGMKGHYEYTKGAIFRLSMEHKLTREQASSIGHATGVCCVCGRELTDPVSVAQGIGPICIQKYF